MPAYSDTAAFPAFTSKQEMLRYIAQECVNCPTLTELLFRINNTAFAADIGADDADVIYIPTDLFASS
jgi:hypothetical protein